MVFVVMALCAAVALPALTGCSLLTPSRENAPKTETRAKLAKPAIKTEGVLTVAIDTKDAPQAMEVDGKLTGYNADVARAIAGKLGLKVAFVDEPAVSDGVKASTADIYVGAAKKDASTKIKVDDTYLEAAPALFTKTEASGAASTAIPRASDLAGKTIGVQTGSASADALTKGGVTGKQKSYDNVNACFKALEAGEVDYVACDSSAGAYLARAYKGVRYVAALEQPKTYGIAVDASRQELAQAVSDAVSSLSGDGTLDAIHTFWYGSMPVTLSDTVLDGLKAASEDEQNTSENAGGTSADGSTADGAADAAAQPNGYPADGGTAAGATSGTGTNAATGTGAGTATGAAPVQE